MEKLTAIVEQLAAKLGVAVDVLWAAMMRQAFISSVADLLWIAGLLYAMTWVVKYVRLVHKKVDDRDWDEIAWLPCAIVCCVAFGFCIGTIASLPMTFAGFFNPEYWALMKILK
jgi:hypothetical protein